MRRYRIFILFLLLAGLGGMTGCSDGVDTGQPGGTRYQGKTDDLLEKQASPMRQAELRKRLIMVQSDR